MLDLLLDSTTVKDAPTMSNSINIQFGFIVSFQQS